jgi:hypothetical protein
MINKNMNELRNGFQMAELYEWNDRSMNGTTRERVYEWKYEKNKESIGLKWDIYKNHTAYNFLKIIQIISV